MFLSTHVIFRLFIPAFFGTVATILRPVDIFASKFGISTLSFLFLKQGQHLSIDFTLFVLAKEFIVLPGIDWSFCVCISFLSPSPAPPSLHILHRPSGIIHSVIILRSIVILIPVSLDTACCFYIIVSSVPFSSHGNTWSYFTSRLSGLILPPPFFFLFFFDSSSHFSPSCFNCDTDLSTSYDPLRPVTTMKFL